MLKPLSLLCLLSFSAFAEELSVMNLEVGDRLRGSNIVTKRECTIDVLKTNEKEVIIAVDGEEDEEYRLRYRKGLLTDEYTAELYNFKDPKLKAIVKANAVLKTGKLSEKTTFRIIQGVYYEGRFVLNTVMDCRNIKEV